MWSISAYQQNPSDLQTKEEERTRAEQIRIRGGGGTCSSFFAKIFENNDETVTLK